MVLGILSIKTISFLVDTIKRNAKKVSSFN